MFRKKADGVVEAAHFDEEGRLMWVRAYERRGPTWSDVVLLDRAALVERLKAGKRFFAGKRKEFNASDFDLGERLWLNELRRGVALSVGKRHVRTDQLEALPIV
ncbi:MAG: hypothetical protein DWG76_00715 [Chloroflexi bacterium]|nr:hypothetical protein [Chloroflexota bacterium]MQC25958.1 hypothetical protein [Chloroflexota bacterium]